eukprot:TRINITY_DN4750_c0_g2_i2.p1 TRINITY_DN4750_c0_g2~~TRINITY_DN4750_c0_g2_i2.p1  ORF type:complete len:656 (+),score=100.95 TRINITY_DN4750_c0_g2_i2:196-2163(+)
MPSDQKGYGWNLPINRMDAVTAVDFRRYSGYCWHATPMGQIMANQTCGSFMFATDNLPFFSNGARPVNRVFTAVQVKVYLPSGQINCLQVKRAKDPADQDFSWQISTDQCSTKKYDLKQRFIKSTFQNATRTEGYLRWAGDPTMMLMLPDDKFEGTITVMQGYEPDLIFDLQFPVGVGPINVETYSKQGCFTIDVNGLASITKDLTTCADFEIVQAGTPDGEDDENRVQVLARFDSRASAKFYSSEGFDNPRETSNVLSQVFSDTSMSYYQYIKFKKLVDAYNGDLGRYGTNRLRAIGNANVQVQPTGSLLANRPGTVSSLILPLNLDPASGDKPTYYSVSVWFRAHSSWNTMPQKSFLLMSFARSAGCVVFVTYNGLLGIECKVPSSNRVVAQVSSLPVSLLNGLPHKIVVIFSMSGNTPVSVHVDGAKVLEINNPRSYNGKHLADNVYLFHDPFFWAYQPLPSYLDRFSLLTSDSRIALLNQAANLGLHLVRRLPFGPITQYVNVTTDWQNCTYSKLGNVYYDMNCTIVPFQNGNRISVSINDFSLGCSRPNCEIAFLPNQSPTGDAFRFQYKPNFPAAFESEDVGNPPMFRDPSLVTDGFRMTEVAFDMLFQKTAPGYLELEVADVVYYKCKESTNPGLTRIADSTSNEPTF